MCEWWEQQEIQITKKKKKILCLSNSTINWFYNMLAIFSVYKMLNVIMLAHKYKKYRGFHLSM